MEEARPRERLDLSIQTPAGPIAATVELPDGFIPVSRIVPLLRQLGEQAQALEQQRTTAAGAAISCAKGCAACCRMLIPVSPPEAFALRSMVAALPDKRRQAVERRIADVHSKLEQARLLAGLMNLAETTRSVTDEETEPLNRAYYELKLPCPFLEKEECSIYPDRPAACRELLVTSPAEWCQDMVNKPVRALPVPLRMGTILSLLWADLTGFAPRLIPLPLALDWADRHAVDNRPAWTARTLLEKALDQVWKFLSQNSK